MTDACNIKTAHEHELGCPAIQAWDIPNACKCGYPSVTRCTRCNRRVRRPDAGCIQCDKPARRRGDMPWHEEMHLDHPGSYCQCGEPKDFPHQCVKPVEKIFVGGAMGDDIDDAPPEKHSAEDAVDKWPNEATEGIAEFWRNKYNEIRVVMIEVADENVALKSKLKPLEQFVAEQAEEDCFYGDGCPSFAGTRHGTCHGCKARKLFIKQIKEQNDFLY